MANRVIYQSLGVMISKDSSSTLATDHEQIFRVQQFSASSNITYSDVNEFGQLAFIDRVNLEPPTASISFQYYATEGFNEEALGFVVNRGKTDSDWTENKGFLGNLLENEGGGKNVYLLIDKEGVDANRTGDGAGLATNQVGVGCLGYGNVYPTDYSANFAVGELPTVDITMEGANATANLISATKDVPLPSVDLSTGVPSSGKAVLAGFVKYDPAKAPKITALRPGDVMVTLENVDGNTLFDFTNDSVKGSHVQSVSISTPLSRTPLGKLGTKYSYARSVDFPLTVTVQVNALLNSISDQTSLAKILETNPKVNVKISVKNPLEPSKVAIEYIVKNCTIDDQNITSSIGSDTTVDLSLSSQVGSKEDTTNGIFVYSESVIA